MQQLNELEQFNKVYKKQATNWKRVQIKQQPKSSKIN
jgi:hypothetical protein